MMRRVRPEIETYTERSWKMLDLPELEDLARDYDEFNQLLLSGRLPYDYFAFANARTSDSAAVYALVERMSSMKLGRSDRPNISV